MSDIRITGVRAIETAPNGCNLIVVRIDTNQPGLYGLGCATFAYRHLTVQHLIETYLRPLLIGKDVRGIPILALEDLPEYVKNHTVDIATLTMPKSEADTIANELASLGVHAIWNFAHVDLELFDKDVIVENVHLSDSLMQLSYNTVKHTKEKGKGSEH